MTNEIPAVSFKDRLRFGFQTNRVKFLFLAHLLVILAVIYIELFTESFELYHGALVASIFIGATIVVLALKQQLLPIVAVLIAYLLLDRALYGSEFEEQELALSVCDYTLSFYCFILLLKEGRDAWQRHRKYLMSWVTFYFLGVVISLWSLPLKDWMFPADIPFYGLGVMYLGATIWEHIKSSE